MARKYLGPATPDAILTLLRQGDYFALLAYLGPDHELERELRALRTAVAEDTRAATMFGYGPRYLHSTGQLHKGGPCDAAPDDSDACHDHPHGPTFVLATFCGTTMGTFLLLEGWHTKRGSAAAVCIFVAGFVMLAEVAFLVRSSMLMQIPS